MIEVLWHGRGGQGAFTAARLLGAAASLADGRYALAFPSFGPERRGAPMRAFTKMSDAPIGDRSATVLADYVVYLDDTLFGEGWEAELAPGGRVFVNSERVFADPRVVAIDANRISTEILGRAIPNTVFLGALSLAIDELSADDVKEAIRLYMPAKLHAKNEAIVDAARAELAGRVDEAGEAAAAGEAASTVAAGEGAAATAADDAQPGIDAALRTALAGNAAYQRPQACIPTIQHDELDPAHFAQNTCFTAGHLVAGNAGWRNIRPIIDADACTGCLQCYLYCPDGAVFKVAPAEGSKRSRVGLDYAFCKGCGMCVSACKAHAVSMVSEPAALAVEHQMKAEVNA